MESEELRARIAAALRARYGRDAITVTTRAVERAPHTPRSWLASASVASLRDGLDDASWRCYAETEIDALAAFAVAVGLDPDGTDPRERPAAQSAMLTADGAAMRAMLSRVVRHETTSPHAHEAVGRWDASNGPLGHGGLPCTRCHTFADARAMLGAARWPTRQEDRETEEVCGSLEPGVCDNAACGCGTRRPWFGPVMTVEAP